MDKKDERFLANLSLKIAESEKNICPELEDISELIDGNMSEKAEDAIKKHIASCKECFELYNLALELKEKPEKKGLTVFSISSIAASVLIVATSFFVFYKGSNVTDKKINSVREIVALTPETRLLKKGKLQIKKEERKSDIGNSESPVSNIVRDAVNKESEEALAVSSPKRGSGEEPIVSSVSVNESFRDSDNDEGLKERKMKMTVLRKRAKPVTPILPGILKIVQPEDTKRLKNMSSKDNVHLKILVNYRGDVNEIKLLSEEKEWSAIVIDTVKKWKFKVSESSDLVFELELKIGVEGKLEIIKKIRGKKNNFPTNIQ